MVEPAFAMHWAESIPKFSSDDGKSEVGHLTHVVLHSNHSFLFYR